MVCAFGTDDGKQFTDRHFGDSWFFDIYQISEGAIHFMQRVAHESEEERQHADPRKAGIIAWILKACGVQAVISRIRKRFVCVRIPEGVLGNTGTGQAVTHASSLLPGVPPIRTRPLTVWMGKSNRRGEVFPKPIGDPMVLLPKGKPSWRLQDVSPSWYLPAA